MKRILLWFILNLRITFCLPSVSSLKMSFLFRSFHFTFQPGKWTTSMTMTSPSSEWFSLLLVLLFKRNLCLSWVINSLLHHLHPHVTRVWRFGSHVLSSVSGLYLFLHWKTSLGVLYCQNSSKEEGRDLSSFWKQSQKEYKRGIHTERNALKGSAGAGNTPT